MPLRMGQVKQIYYWPVLWHSSVQAGKGDIIGMEERLCNWGGVILKFLGLGSDAIHHVTAQLV